MNEVGIRPSRGWYFLACVLVLAGMVPFAFSVVSLVRKTAQNPQQVIVPGKGTVTISKPGPYMIYYEHRTLVNGQVLVTPLPLPPMTCQLVEVDSAQEVKLSPLRGTFTYETSQRKAVGVWRFDIDRPGTYELSAAYGAGASGPPKLVLSVGPGGLVGTILGACGTGALAAVSALAGVGVFVVTLVKRMACKKRRLEAKAG